MDCKTPHICEGYLELEGDEGKEREKIGRGTLENVQVDKS